MNIELNNPQLWETPLIKDREFMETEQYHNDIIDPASKALQENMLRAPIAELCDLSTPSSSDIIDMGKWPWKFRGKEQIFPFITKLENESLFSGLNPDYESKDLVQISQRIKPGKAWPKFRVTRKDIEESGFWKSIVQVTMTGFLVDDWEFEVVKVQ